LADKILLSTFAAEKEAFLPSVGQDADSHHYT